jgi:hypothetical protein
MFQTSLVFITLPCPEGLTISSSVMLNYMVSIDGFIVPPTLDLQGCNEPSILFERPENLTSVRYLRFIKCAMQCLPTELKSLSCLAVLQITDCSNLSSLPDLPTSLEHLVINRCELLKGSCKPDGENWSKIEDIPGKNIENEWHYGFSNKKGKKNASSNVDMDNLQE